MISFTSKNVVFKSSSDDEFDFDESDSFEEFAEPKQSTCVAGKGMKRLSVLTQTKRSSRVEEADFFRKLLEEEDLLPENSEEESESEHLHEFKRDSAIIRTKSGQVGLLKSEAEDECEKIGLIEVDGVDMFRRQSSYKEVEAGTSLSQADGEHFMENL